MKERITSIGHPLYGGLFRRTEGWRRAVKGESTQDIDIWNQIQVTLFLPFASTFQRRLSGATVSLEYLVITSLLNMLLQIVYLLLLGFA